MDAGIFKGKKCPFCKTSFNDDDVVVVCSICDMPYHLSCWQENSGCATFGCTGIIKETYGLSLENPPAPPQVTYNAPVQPPVQAAPQVTYNAPVQPPVQAYNPPVVPVQQMPIGAVPETPAAKPVNVANRFETLSDSTPETIFGNIPVLVEKVTLMTDNQDNSIVARCVFRALTDNEIVAMLIDISCTDIWGNATKTVEGYQYLDLKTKRGDLFGQTVSVKIPDNATRNIDVKIQKVMFADRTMLDSNGVTEVLPSQITLKEYLGSEELASEYRRNTADTCAYNIIECSSFWRCSCGAINSAEDGSCYSCKCEKELMKSLLDTATLTDSLEQYKEEKRIQAEKEEAARQEQIRQAEEQQRLEQEEKERLEKEEAEKKAEEERIKKEKQKKILKISGISAAGAVVVAVIVYLIGWQLVPGIRYSKANKLLAALDYDQAITIFTDLGNFRDSADMATESKYQKAVSLMNAESYADAATLFNSIVPYKDSTDLGKNCSNEATYRHAKELFDAKSYEESYTAYKSITGYKDSAALANEAEYQYAVACFANKEYEKSYAAFKVCAAASYKDSADKSREAGYQYGLALKAASKWTDAKSVFNALGTYKDSATLLKECTYQYAVELLVADNYSAAITQFNSILDYKDSQSKIYAAKYEYVQMNKNSSDATTYQYLKDLKAAGYKDSATIYKSLYAWTVTLVINNSESDETTNRYSISKYDTVYCHVKLSGGPPTGEGIPLSYKYKWPGGTTKYDSWDGYWYDGSTGDFYTWYNTPYYGNTGTFTTTIYDASTGDALGSASVTITN